MGLMKFRSMSAAELARDRARFHRFEVWREEPNAADRPYRRKRDQRTKHVWHAAPKTWKDVIELVKRGQHMKIRTYLRRGFIGGSRRIISVRIENRVASARGK